MNGPDDTLPRSDGRRPLWAALLACLGIVSYLPALRAGFVWDDDAFLTSNPLIHAAHGLRRIWFSTRAADYWPVASTSLWFEWRLWGPHAAGYHATNLALHIAAALVLWSILSRLRVPGAYLAALLFLVHPLNVESVAWITQRKNLLAMLFSLLSLRWCLAESYRLGFVAFVLAMLSKGSAAMLPIVIVLILAWQHRLSGAAWRRLIPFFAVSALLVVVDIWFQSHGRSSVLPAALPLHRILGAGAVLWFYLGKSLFPARLAFFYPQWQIRVGEVLWWCPLAAALGVTALLAWFRQGRLRPLWIAWLAFGATLVPVMGLASIYYMRYSLVADHYAHFAVAVVAAVIAAGLARWRATGAIAVFALSAITLLQCRQYRDAETLYRSSLRLNPGSWLAHNNLGVILIDRGETAQARRQFEAALQLNPGYPEAHIGLAHVFLNSGRPADAARECEEALRTPSDFGREARLNWGHALYAEGRPGAALDQYRAALAIDPDYAEAHYSAGNVLIATGRYGEAIAEYRQALRSAPEDAAIHGNLGAALLLDGNARLAAQEFELALRLNPGDPTATAGLRQAKAVSNPK